MNWLKTFPLYLPPLFSIYLIVISNFSKTFFTKRVASFVSGTAVLKTKERVIRNIGLDWAACLGFFNSMFAAMFSVLTIWSKTGKLEGAVITLGILLLIFIPMMWWIMSKEADELVVKSKTLHMTPAAFCSSIVLVIVNIMLIIAISISQRLIQTASN